LESGQEEENGYGGEKRPSGEHDYKGLGELRLWDIASAEATKNEGFTAF
jgi:hypothetical protein